MDWKFPTILGLCAAALGADAAAQASTIWAQAPSLADVANAYPAKAKAAGVGGSVDLTCTIARTGHPKDCEALGEKPTGYGFGFAARKLATELRVEDPGKAGQEVRVPVTFDPAVLTGAPTITRPTWAQLPEAEDFQASFPKAENGINQVRVVLACKVADDGALTGCSIDQEEPAGQGFGAGALALAPKFKVGPWSQDGLPTAGAKIRVPIRYQLTQVAPPPAAKP